MANGNLRSNDKHSQLLRVHPHPEGPMKLNQNRRSRLPLFAILVVACAFPVATEAGIIVSIQNTTINAGLSGTIDVLVHKDAGDPDWNVLFAQYSFQITPDPGAVGSLEFDAAQPDTEQGDASYLFSAFQPTGNFSGIQNGVFQYDGGDFTSDLADLATISATDLLLARLNVTHILPLLTPPGAADGSTFTVSLINANTDFLDDNLDPIAFAGNSGTITINGAAAVPEPSSIVMLVAVTGFLAVRRRRQSRNRLSLDALS